MRPALYSISIILLCVACISLTDKKEESTSEEELSYLALGDSYTIGESVPEKDRWPMQLAECLNDQKLGFGKPTIVARTGWRTDELIAAIEHRNFPDQSFDMVSLLIGVNNQFQGKDIKQFEKEFEELLNTAIARSNVGAGTVFVLSIPDYGATPFGAKNAATIAKEIDAYNAICQTACEQHGVRYFDITPISRKAADDSTLLAVDRLHPSGKMYKQWIDLIKTDIIQMLQ